MQLKWSHAVVYVKDMEQMLDFYTGTLGFEVTDRGPLGKSEIVFMSQVDTDHHQLAFVDARKEAGASNSVNHFAFRVESLDDVRSVHDSIQADERISEIRPVTHGNAWSVYFSDPEGNGIEIFCDSPWHVQQPQGKPYDLSLSNDEIVAATQSEFESEPEFGDIERFYERRTAELADRQSATSKGS